MTHAAHIADVTRSAAHTLRRLRPALTPLAAALVWWGLLSGVAAAQSAPIPSNAQNAVDYRERSSVRVDPATGALQFHITLGGYKGRGGLDLPVTLYYSSKVWEVRHLGTIHRGIQCTGCAGEPDSTYGGFFSLYSAAGWTSNLDWFKWGEPPVFETYDETGKACESGCSSRVARLFLRLSDGARHEFRRDDTIYPFSSNVQSGTYHSVDGSRLRYDASSGTLYLPDGSRYLSEWTAAGVHLRHYIDRHGNRLSYNDSTKLWTDTLGRSYGLPPLDASAPADRTYSLPGVGGEPQPVTFVWRRLEEVRTDAAQPLHYVGDRTTTYPHTPVSPSLFTSPNMNDSMVDGYNGQPFNPVLLHKIVLADQTTYTFTYNVYGEIDKVVYPGGGYEKFTYGVAPPLSAHVFDLSPAPQANRGVVERRVSARGDGTDESVWGYVLGSGSVVTAPDGTRTESYNHASAGVLVLYGFDDPRAGRPYEERVVTASGQVLRRKLTEWAVDGTAETRGAFVIHKQRNPRVTKEVTVILDTAGNALSTTTKYEYDADLNLKKVEKYGYREVTETNPQTGGIGGFLAGNLLRVEETDYLTDNQAYRDRNMLSLPTATRVRDGALTLLAQTEVRYDEVSYTPLPCGATVGWADPGTGARGLATTTRSWLNTTGGWLETHAQYDQCGSLREMRDAHEETAAGHGRESQVEYADSFSDGVVRNTFAYPTRTLSAVPDSTGNNGSDAPLETASTYDFKTGLVVSATDVNNQATTSYSYRDPDTNALDPLGRLRRVSLADGGWTRYDYGSSPGNFFVRTRTAIDASRAADSYRFFDGLGRPSRSYSYDGSAPERAWVATKTQQYEQTRRVKVSNPHFRVNLDDFDLDSTANPVPLTTTTSDPLGRVTSVMSPDGAIATTEYSGAEVTITDQAGRKRRSVSDALGRLVKVVEAPGVADYGYETTYEYDVLGNLKKVIQGKTGQAQQTRHFNYDSLSRLTSATNPESGTTSYEYDAAGNLKKKIDARHVQTDYAYDALNRVVGRSYSIVAGHQPPAGYIATPGVSYYYDGTGMPTENGAQLPTPPNSAGRLTAVKSPVSETIYTKFDPAGRVEWHRQIVDPGTSLEQTYLMAYGYDLAGNLTTETYPSGKVFETAYDGAGRVAGVKQQTTGFYYAGAAATDADNRVKYAPHGAVSEMKLGNSLWEHTSYNNRLQPVEIGLGSSATDSGKLQLVYGYGAAGQNNGNVRIQRIHVAGALDLTQTYEYDAVNRLLSAREAPTAGGADAWRQAYTYLDATGQNGQFGNRRIDTGTDTAGQALTTANAMPPNNPTINPLNNRFNDNQGYAYDAAGNLRQDPSHSYAYDAENKMAAVDGGWNGASGANYYYDGDGRRVKKVSVSETTVFVYDVTGRVVAEYSNQVRYNGTRYLTQDHLGSTRVVTDGQGNAHSNNGANGSRHDYFPFGEEIQAGVDGRTTAQGYNQTDQLRQKFTSYERDVETGLDYAQARYYSNAQGRFTSPDPLLSSGRSVNPKTWNRYNYSLNNPLRYIDPTGLFEWDATLQADSSLSKDENKKRERLRNSILSGLRNSRKKAGEALAKGKITQEKYDKIIRSLDSYGAEPGQNGSNNGVTVGLGAQDRSGTTDPQFTYTSNADGTGGTVSATISVQINENTLGLGDNFVEAAIVHEGSHVADASDFAKAWTGYRDLDSPLNLTDYANEVRAFQVSSYYLEATGVNGSKIGLPVWENDWGKKKVDEQALLRQTAIDAVLAGRPYFLSEQSKGLRLSSRIKAHK